MIGSIFLAHSTNLVRIATGILLPAQGRKDAQNVETERNITTSIIF